MSVKKYYNIAKNNLYPICRSITGQGTFKTLKIIKNSLMNLKIKKIKSAFPEIMIPPEWNIIDAYVIDKDGLKIIDFKKQAMLKLYCFRSL